MYNQETSDKILQKEKHTYARYASLILIISWCTLTLTFYLVGVKSTNAFYQLIASSLWAFLMFKYYLHIILISSALSVLALYAKEPKQLAIFSLILNFAALTFEIIYRLIN